MPPFSILGSILCFTCCIAGAPIMWADTATAFPADNPYAGIVTAYDRLSPNDLASLRQNHPVSAEALPLLGEIAKALSVGRQSASINWGDNETHAGSARSALKAYRIAPVALAYAALSAPDDANVVARTVLDVTALGRHVGREGAFIHWMNEMSVEQKTADWLAHRLFTLTPAEAGSLIKELAALPPGGDLATSLAAEKTYYLDPILDDLRTLLADTAEKTGGTASELRMAGMLSEGSIHSIGLEVPSGETVWLKPGQTRHGITLLSVNPSDNDAFLLRDKRVLSIQLKSREINELNPEQLRQRWSLLPEKNGLRALTGDTLPTPHALAATVNLLSMINDFYEDVLADPHRYREQKNRDDRIAKIPAELREMAPVVLFDLLTSADRTEVVRTQLAAALAARAQGDTPPRNITDPVTGHSMLITPLASGYVLESDSQFNGKPVLLTVRGGSEAN